MSTEMKSRSIRFHLDVDAALVATSEREGKSINAVVEEAVRVYTGERSRRIDELTDQVVERDGALLDRLGSM